MNDAVFFRTADYTKNKNLVMDDSTVYELDRECLARNQQEEPEEAIIANSIDHCGRRREEIAEQNVAGIDTDAEQLEAFCANERMSGRNCNNNTIFFLFIILLFCGNRR